MGSPDEKTSIWLDPLEVWIYGDKHPKEKPLGRSMQTSLWKLVTTYIFSGGIYWFSLRNICLRLCNIEIDRPYEKEPFRLDTFVIWVVRLQHVLNLPTKYLFLVILTPNINMKLVLLYVNLEQSSTL